MTVNHVTWRKPVRRMVVVSAILGLVLAGASGCAPASDSRPGVAGMARTQGRPDGEYGGDVVDFTRTSQDGTVRILLDSAGAARVDFAEKGGARSRSFVLPTNGAEVERLAVSIAALCEVTKEKCHLDVPEPRAAFSQDIAIGFRHGQRVGAIRIKSNKVMKDLLWKGVVDEIEAVGLLELARAFDEGARGEAIATRAEGDKSEAIACFENAINRFTLWASTRRGRYAVGLIWEPELYMEFVYQTDAGEDMLMRGWPPKIMEVPGITPQWALKALEYGWQEYTEEFVAEQADGATVITLLTPAGGNEWTWGLTRPEIPKGLAQAMMAASRPAAK